VTVPIVVVAALVLGGGGSPSPSSSKLPSVAPPVSVAAPPSSDDATVSLCARVISALPLRLDGQNLRRTTSSPPSASIVAWGSPAIVFRCGVARPASLHPGSTAQYFSATGQAGPYYDVNASGDANVYTTVDRAVYLDVTIPVRYHVGPLPTISRAIASVLPAVCVAGEPTTGPLPPTSQLCSHRK
jgi:hypothetical protein